MLLETNLKEIAKQAREKWQDNWNFRAFLQKHVSAKEVDQAVHRLNEDVSAQIDCTQCANCCKKSSPFLTKDDVQRIAAAANMSEIDFVARYLKDDEFEERTFRKRPCPMLKMKRCQVYEARPEDCSSYPHLHEPDFVQYSASTIENYGVCPIVFNVYEGLKRKFPYTPFNNFLDSE